MGSAEIMRIFVVAIGIVLLIADFMCYCRQKMRENFGFAWGVFSVILILLGAVPGLSAWSRLISAELCVVVLILGIVVIWILFFISMVVSGLMAKNQELAMQVSLINCELQRVLAKMEEMTGEDIMEIK